MFPKCHGTKKPLIGGSFLLLLNFSQFPPMCVLRATSNIETTHGFHVFWHVFWEGGWGRAPVCGADADFVFICQTSAPTFPWKVKTKDRNEKKISPCASRLNVPLNVGCRWRHTLVLKLICGFGKKCPESLYERKVVKKIINLKKKERV